jgi:hypothetical protein
MLKYNVVTDDGNPSSVTVFPSGRAPLVATVEHPHFTLIMDAITKTGTSEEAIVDLFDRETALKGKFLKVSDRVSIRGGNIFFDNVKQNGVLAEATIQFYLAGHEDYMSLVNFMEKIEQNPNPHSREHLFRWLKSAKFSITPDGDIIGYKGVNTKGIGTTDEYYVSTVAGPAIVDGEEVNGYVPNRPGVIVEMARNEVTFDPRVTCSHGLHVADWSYAKGMGSKVLLVLVNPRDVVSVPVDAGDKKMRVCRYKVLKTTTSEETEMLHVDRELHTLTARMPTWVQPKALVKSSTPRKAVKKAAAAVKKAVSKKPAKKLAPVAAIPEPRKKAPVKKAVTKATTTAKKATVPSKATSNKLPKHYEKFSLENFSTLPYRKLVWLAGQWDIKPPTGRAASDYAQALTHEAARRLDKATRKTVVK